MSDDCQDKLCQDKVNRVNRAVFGEDGNYSGSIAKQLSDKIDKKELEKYMKAPPIGVIIAIFTAIIIPLFVIAVNVWSSNQSAPLKYASRHEVSKLQEDTLVIQKSLEGIEKSQVETRKRLDMILDLMLKNKK